MKARKRKTGTKPERDLFRHTLLSSKPQTVLSTLRKLKREKSYGQAKALFEHLQSPLIDDALNTKIKIDDWSALHGYPALPPSANWVQELGWLSHTFIKNRRALNIFIERRQQFGAAFVSGKYELAKEILDGIESEFGLSFWLLERRLMLAQEREGFDQHKGLLNSIRESCQNPYVNYIAFLISSRLEPHVGPEAYKKQVADTLIEIKEENPTLGAAIEFQVSFWTRDWLPYAHFILLNSNSRCLIDRYNTAIKIILSKYREITSENPLEYHLKKITRDLAAAIHDPQLRHFVDATTEGASSIDERTREIIKIHDLLITEKNESAAKEATTLLQNEPLSFDSYWLAAYTQIATGITINCNFPPTSTGSEIFSNLTKTLDNKNSIELALEVLSNRALKIGDNHLGISTSLFVDRERDGFVDEELQEYAAAIGKHSIEGVLSNSFYNPPQVASQQLLAQLPDSPTVQIIAYRHGLIQAEDGLAKIGGPLVKIEKANRLIKAGNYSEVIKIVSDLARSGAQTKPLERLYQTDAAQLLFDALLEQGDYCEAAEEVFSIYSNNPNNLRHVAFEKLIRLGKDGTCPQLVSTIYWPILALLNNGDEQDLYEAVDDYFIANSIDGPTTFLKEDREPFSAAERVVIREILRPQVIERSPFWTSSQDDQRDLRSALLRKLFEASEEDQGFVVHELSQIESERLLESDYRNVEGPKFILDFTDVNRRMLPLLQGSFDRYMLYKTFEKSGGKLEDQKDLFERVMGKTTGEPSKELKGEKLEVSDIALLNAATSLFLGYLWDSRNGINSTLGTRIRHGSLENQLKRSFEARNLLASRNLDGAYECSSPMMIKLAALGDTNRNTISDAIFVFTDRVYDICGDLVSNKLRLKVPPGIVALLKKDGLPVNEMAHEEGLLDFSSIYLPEKLLSNVIADQISSTGAFVDICRRIFEEGAVDALSSVVKHLDQIVGPDVARAAEQLEAVIRGCTGDDDAITLLGDEITTARDDFSYDMRIIKNWFSVARNIDQITGSLVKLIEMAAKVVDFASNRRLGSLKSRFVTDKQVEGLGRVMIYEVLLIIFRNIVKHSGLEDSQEVIYDIENNGDQLCLTFENLVTSHAAKDKAIEEAHACLKDGSDGLVLSKGPGKTGLKRIRDLLAQVTDQPVELTVGAGSDSNGRPAFQVKICFHA